MAAYRLLVLGQKPPIAEVHEPWNIPNSGKVFLISSHKHPLGFSIVVRHLQTCSAAKCSYGYTLFSLLAITANLVELFGFEAATTLANKPTSRLGGEK
jgi:hypothetical protein